MKSNSSAWRYVRLQFVFGVRAQPDQKKSLPADEAYVDASSSDPLLTTALGIEPWPVTTITSVLNFE